MAKLLLGRRKNKFSSSEGVLELSVLRGRNLVPKDSNGQSLENYTCMCAYRHSSNRSTGEPG